MTENGNININNTNAGVLAVGGNTTAPKWTKEYHRQHMRDMMREKRKVNPDYGKPRVQKTTIAFCRKCKEERNWRDAEKQGNVFYCPVCDAAMYTLIEQRGIKDGKPKQMRRKTANVNKDESMLVAKGVAEMMAKAARGEIKTHPSKDVIDEKNTVVAVQKPAPYVNLDTIQPYTGPLYVKELPDGSAWVSEKPLTEPAGVEPVDPETELLIKRLSGVREFGEMEGDVGKITDGEAVREAGTAGDAKKVVPEGKG